MSASSSSDATLLNSSRKRPFASSETVHVPRLQNVIVNVRDAGGRGGSVREFLLVFPGIVTNTRTIEVMKMIEHHPS